MATTVILAFFVGMLFRDLALLLLLVMARRSKRSGTIMVDGKPVATDGEMEALAKAIVDRTMSVELLDNDGMLYLYCKSDGMFLAQATNREQLVERLRQRFGEGRFYVLDDDEVINT